MELQTRPTYPAGAWALCLGMQLVLIRGAGGEHKVSKREFCWNGAVFLTRYNILSRTMGEGSNILLRWLVEDWKSKWPALNQTDTRIALATVENNQETQRSRCARICLLQLENLLADCSTEGLRGHSVYQESRNCASDGVSAPRSGQLRL